MHGHGTNRPFRLGRCFDLHGKMCLVHSPTDYDLHSQWGIQSLDISFCWCCNCGPRDPVVLAFTHNFNVISTSRLAKLPLFLMFGSL